MNKAKLKTYQCKAVITTEVLLVTKANGRAAAMRNFRNSQCAQEGETSHKVKLREIKEMIEEGA